jgi:hypothetical protein
MEECMKVRSFWYLLIAAAVLALAGCGGGGGGGTTAPVVSNSVAVVQLSVIGGGGSIGGIDMTFDLPAGVTVAADADGAVTTAITLQGAAVSALKVAKYTAATATTPGKVHIALVSSTAISDGIFATVNCDIASGTTVPLSSFSNALLESGTNVVDTNGTVITGAAVTLSAVY